MAQYHNLPKVVQVAARAPWYEVDELMREVAFLRKVNFSIVEQRSQALERINNLTSSQIFTPLVRFPGDERMFICEILGDWPRKFQQLKSSLSFKERDLRTHGIESKDAHSGATFSDAQQAFWNATTSIYDELCRLDHVFDRDTFESIYHLDWH